MRRLWEDKIGQTKLDGVVNDICSPELVSNSLKADRDAVILNCACCILNKTVQSHTFSSESKGENLDRIDVVHGSDERGWHGLKDEEEENNESGSNPRWPKLAVLPL